MQNSIKLTETCSLKVVEGLHFDFPPYDSKTVQVKETNQPKLYRIGPHCALLKQATRLNVCSIRACLLYSEAN